MYRQGCSFIMDGRKKEMKVGINQTGHASGLNLYRKRQGKKDKKGKKVSVVIDITSNKTVQEREN